MTWSWTGPNGGVVGGGLGSQVVLYYNCVHLFVNLGQKIAITELDSRVRAGDCDGYARLV